MQHKKPITLITIVRGELLEVSIEHDNDRCFSTKRIMHKIPRVKGFSSEISEPQMLESFHNIAESDDPKKLIQVINDYIRSADEVTNDHTIDILRITKKIIVKSKQREIALSIRDKLIKEHKERSNRCSSTDSKPCPKAKCTSCDTFYSELPNDHKCTKCGKLVREELRPNTWFMCQVCYGTGFNKRFKKVCSSCNAQGWLFQNLFKL